MRSGPVPVSSGVSRDGARLGKTLDEIPVLQQLARQR
jgi:hypothetical protein